MFQRSMEAERYPALLAWHEECIRNGVRSDALPWVFENPEEEIFQDPGDLFEHYLEIGEMGAAQFLLRKDERLSREQFNRGLAQWGQAFLQGLLEARDNFAQLDGLEEAEVRSFREELESMDRNPLWRNQRPGPARRILEGLNGRMQELAKSRGEAIQREMEELKPLVATNSDVAAALRKIQDHLGQQEGLPTAGRYLAIARRAARGSLTTEDMKQLFAAPEESARLVRTWTDTRALLGEGVNTSGLLLEELSKEETVGRFIFPGTYDLQRLLDILKLRPGSKRADTEKLAEAIQRFVGKGFALSAGRDTILGAIFNLSLARARHRELTTPARKLLLLIPRNGTDPSSLGKLVQDAQPQGAQGKSLTVLFYPGVLDPDKPMAQQIGMTPVDVAFLDCLDLVRLGEVPEASRPDAFQQVILPRLPGLAGRTYQKGGPVAAELFRGRASVIDGLTLPGGWTVLFSGRMMGKSSVLKQIKERYDREPTRTGQRKCLLVSTSGGNLLDPLLEELFSLLPLRIAEAHRKELAKMAISHTVKPAERERREEVRLQIFRKVVQSVLDLHPLTLLIDEADEFATEDSQKPRKLSLAWVLRDLENAKKERLRIVFAGFQTLHHEVIASNGAFANWFGYKALEPFDRDEAVSLIQEPLADFGVQFLSESGVERVIEFTGKYPLMIQEVCERLMTRAISRRPRTGPESETVYLRAGDVDVVCREESLRNRLRQTLSLNLDKYPRLKLVTYLILQASAYRAVNGSQERSMESFSSLDVRGTLLEWYGDRLSTYFSETDIPRLLEELVALGLIGKAEEGGHFRFLNGTFAGMLRDNPRFEEELLALLTEVANPSDSEARRYWSLPKEHLETLLVSTDHILLGGLPSTLKSDIVHQLFSRESGTLRSQLVDRPELAGLGPLLTFLRKGVSSNRSLTLGELCRKEDIHVLVLDCPLMSYSELRRVSENLKGSGCRLIATATPPVLRDYQAHAMGFNLISLRRLRAQDIIAWGAKPYPADVEGNFSIVIDKVLSEDLLTITGGYFPLLQRFRQHCDPLARSKNEREFFPTGAHVEQFRRGITPEVVHDILLAPLEAPEREMLRRTVSWAFQDGDRLRIPEDLLDEQIRERAESREEQDAWRLSVEVLVDLDLLAKENLDGNFNIVVPAPALLGSIPEP